MVYVFFFFKQKTAYEMRISDWSSDVCSSDLQVSRSIGDEREASASLFCLEAGGRCSSSIRRSIPRESAIQKSAMIISAGPVGKAGVTWQGINPASGGQTRRRRL